MGPTTPGSGDTKGDELLWAVFGIIALSVLIVLVVWYNWHTYLSTGAIWAAYHTLPILTYASKFMAAINIPLYIQDLFIPSVIIDQAAALRRTLPLEEPGHIEKDVFFFLISIPGVAIRFLLIPFSIYGAFYIYRNSKPARMCNKYDIYDLARISQDSFPHLKPAFKENLLKIDPDTGHFRREASPIRFGIINEVLRVPCLKNSGELIIPTFSESLGKTTGYVFVKDRFRRGMDAFHGQYTIDHKALEETFIQQLGEKWTSSNDLPPLIRALYSALICFACSDKDLCAKLLDQFNESWEPPTSKSHYCTFDITGVDDAIKKHELNDIIVDLNERHAYVNTMLPALLGEARNKGKIWTALFPWLKTVDRTLWYAMNQEGGQCGWSESAGARAHIVAEIKLGFPLHSPFIKTAIDAYFENLVEEGWVSTEMSIMSEDAII